MLLHFPRSRQHSGVESHLGHVKCPGGNIRYATTRRHKVLLSKSQSAMEQQKPPHVTLLCTVAAMILHATFAGSALCQTSSDSLNDLPPELSGGDSTKPRSLGILMGDKEVQGCARKCVATCIRGGGGAPGLGPLSQRRELIVFKEGYRSRQYCLSECIQVCAAALKAK